MLARVEAELYIGFLNILMYTGVSMFMATMLLVAYVGDVIGEWLLRERGRKGGKEWCACTGVVVVVCCWLRMWVM